MRFVMWRICSKLNKNVLSKRIVFTNAIYNTASVGQKPEFFVTSRLYHVNNFFLVKECINHSNTVTNWRTYAKKKKPTRQEVEELQADDKTGSMHYYDKNFGSESEDEEPMFDDEQNIVTRNVQSLRVDNILKAGLSISKKQIDKEFYASNIRVNGDKITKKSFPLQENDELDLVKHTSPENPKFIMVDRVVIKSIGKVTGSFTYPIKLQVFKSLAVENYQDSWVPIKDEFV